MAWPTTSDPPTLETDGEMIRYPTIERTYDSTDGWGFQPPTEEEGGGGGGSSAPPPVVRGQLWPR